jgi:hypothetical protein
MTDLAAVNPDKYAVPKSEVVSAERTSLRRMPKIEDRLAERSEFELSVPIVRSLR